MLKIIDDSRCELLPFHVMTVGTKYDQMRMERPEGYCAHHIFCVEEGSGVFETAKGTMTLSAGSVLFIRRDYPTVYYPAEETFRVGFVTFNGDAVEPFLQYYRAEDFMVCHSEGLVSMIGHCARMGAKNASPDELSHVLYEILVRFFRECRGEEETSSVARAKAYMEEHLQDVSLSVEQIAHAVGISPSLLYRLFREEAHLTPVDHLRHMRIHRAKELLLQEPKMRISELSVACGFSNTAYFCKVFKDLTDMTPRAFLKAYHL